MPRISNSQKQSIAGEAAAHAFLSRLGWLGEKFHNDFGEDAVFQFPHGDRIEPFKVVCQIKTTAKQRIQIDTDTVRKWILSLDHFIVVIVSPELDRFHYIQLCEHFSLSEVMRSEKQSMSINRSAFRQLDESEVRFIEWTCRIRGLNKLLLECIGWKEHADVDDTASDANVFKLDLSIIEIAILTLSYLGLVTSMSKGVRLRGDLVALRVAAIASMERENVANSSVEDGMSLREILLVVLLYRMSELVPDKTVPIPGGLLHESHKLLCSLSELALHEWKGLLDKPFNSI